MEAATAAARRRRPRSRCSERVEIARDRYEAHWLIYTGGGGGPPGAGPVNPPRASTRRARPELGGLIRVLLPAPRPLRCARCQMALARRRGRDCPIAGASAWVRAGAPRAEIVINWLVSYRPLADSPPCIHFAYRYEQKNIAFLANSLLEPRDLRAPCSQQKPAPRRCVLTAAPLPQAEG